jgi:hypothetical protein
VKGAPAHFVTRTIQPQPRQTRLFMNADGVTTTAPLVVELLDERDRPLPGYSGTDAARLLTGGTRQEVIWPGARGAALPPDQAYAVKVIFPAEGDARVFALYLG